MWRLSYQQSLHYRKAWRHQATCETIGALQGFFTTCTLGQETDSLTPPQPHPLSHTHPQHSNSSGLRLCWHSLSLSAAGLCKSTFSSSIRHEATVVHLMQCRWRWNGPFIFLLALQAVLSCIYTDFQSLNAVVMKRKSNKLMWLTKKKKGRGVAVSSH